MSTEKLQIE